MKQRENKKANDLEIYDFYANIENMNKHKLSNLTVYIEQDEDGVFVGSIPVLNSCYAEGKTQAEMLKNLEKVAKLCLRNQKKIGINAFVGIQNIELKNA